MGSERRTVLIAPTVEVGEAIVRRSPDLAGALVVTPRSLDRVRGCNVHRMAVVDVDWPDADALARTVEAVKVAMATTPGAHQFYPAVSP